MYCNITKKGDDIQVIYSTKNFETERNLCDKRNLENLKENRNVKLMSKRLLNILTIVYLIFGVCILLRCVKNIESAIITCFIFSFITLITGDIIVSFAKLYDDFEMERVSEGLYLSYVLSKFRIELINIIYNDEKRNMTFILTNEHGTKKAYCSDLWAYNVIFDSNTNKVLLNLEEEKIIIPYY